MDDGQVPARIFAGVGTQKSASIKFYVISKRNRKEGTLEVAHVMSVAATSPFQQVGISRHMRSAQHHFGNRLHPKLSCLEIQFRELLLRPFDPDTLSRLMRMEVETLFPGLNERDQAKIVDIVLEHMQAHGAHNVRARMGTASNVIPFPAGGRARHG